MVDLEDVARMAMELPEVSVGERYGNRSWSVRDKSFAWERPFSKADVKRFGAVVPPTGVMLAVRVDDLADKEAALQAHPTTFFTIPHFDGFSAVLIQLQLAGRREVREAILDGWLACAPPKLAEGHLRSMRRRPR